MDDTKKTDTAKMLHKTDFGEKLRRKRMLKKISIEDLSKKTRISQNIINNLESSQYDTLPSEAYTIGFLQTYCNIIEEDPSEYIASYRKYLRRKSEYKHSKINLRTNIMTMRQNNHKQNAVFTTSIILLLLGVAITMGFIYYQNTQIIPSNTLENTDLETRESTVQSTNGDVDTPASPISINALPNVEKTPQ